MQLYVQHILLGYTPHIDLKLGDRITPSIVSVIAIINLSTLTHSRPYPYFNEQDDDPYDHRIC